MSDRISNDQEVLIATAPASFMNIPPEFILMFAKSNADWAQLDRLIAEEIGEKKNLRAFYAAGNYISLDEKTGKFSAVFKMKEA